MRKLRQKVADSCLDFHDMLNVLGICYGFPQNCVDGVLVATNLVVCNQFCTFKDMSVESEWLHAQNSVYKKSLSRHCNEPPSQSR